MTVVEPVAKPINAPVVTLIVPTAVLELLHVPPAGVADSVVVVPEHTAEGPDMPPGKACTVTMRVVVHPLTS